MNIALVSESYYPHTGSQTEHVHHLGSYLAARGHHVRIITSASEPRRTSASEPRRTSASEPRRTSQGEPGREVVSLRREVVRLGRGLGLPRRIAEALDGCDLVHVHAPLSAGLALKQARLLGLPTVGTFHARPGVVHNLFWRHRLDAGIALSAPIAKAVRHFVAGECEVIPSGVDCAAWASARPYHTSKPTIVFLGQLDKSHELEVLLEAFARVTVKAQLVVVGEGPCRPSLIPANVLFVGEKQSVAERARYLASAQVMACTARQPSQSLLEGLAAGLPIVAWDLPGARELVTEGRHGYKVPPGDAAALADALSRVLADGARRELMARAARRQAARFDWREVGPRIEAVYRLRQGEKRAAG